LRLRLAVLALLAAGPALAHDIYGQFYSGGAPGVGRWCCNGNTEGTTGDCAPAEYRMLPDGSALMQSKRYPGKTIHVAAGRILWMTIPGGEAFEAHLCALPRRPGEAVTPDDPDPEFVTLCAAINPRGF
jgi:hypothetical protein